MRTESLIERDTASRLAGASMRYRLTRPAFWVPIAVEVALAGAFAASGHPLWAVALLVVAALAPLMLFVQTPRLAAEMARRGYRPHTVLAVEWLDDAFTVESAGARGTHRYEHVTGARLVGEAVVLRIRGARVLLVLPRDVVPESVRPRLGLRT